MTRTAEEQRALDFVLEMFENVLRPLDSSKADRYISQDYIQHSQMAPPGLASLKAFLDTVRQANPNSSQEIKRAFVDGNHVMLHYHVIRFPGDPGFAVMDIFRLENGLIAEHWDVVQDVPTNSPNPNSMF